MIIRCDALPLRFALRATRWSLACLCACILLLLQGCGTGPMARDGLPPGFRGVDVDKIPDAVPRVEQLDPRKNKPYWVLGRHYVVLKSNRGFVERGIASWYGYKFHARRTSNGDRYDMFGMTAAHKTLPIPSYVRVTNLENGRQVVVRVNDRGPFAQNRIIDLSYVAAKKLAITGRGTGLVEVVALQPGESTHIPERDPRIGNRPAHPKLYLQVGSFSAQARAESLRERLARFTRLPTSIYTLRRLSGTVYRVTVGPLASVEATDQMKVRIEQAGFGTALTVISPDWRK